MAPHGKARSYPQGVSAVRVRPRLVVLQLLSRMSVRGLITFGFMEKCPSPSNPTWRAEFRVCDTAFSGEGARLQPSRKGAERIKRAEGWVGDFEKK